MVQIIENHAEISGELLAIERDPARPGFVTLRVTVRAAKDADRSPNFFTRDIGRTIAIAAREDGAVATAPLGAVRLRVKKTGLDVSFAELVLP